MEHTVKVSKAFVIENLRKELAEYQTNYLINRKR